MENSDTKIQELDQIIEDLKDHLRPLHDMEVHMNEEETEKLWAGHSHAMLTGNQVAIILNILIEHRK